MRPREAGALFALLTANWPRTKAGETTTELWLDELSRVDHRLGKQAVKGLIATCRYWPSIADLNEQLRQVREQLDRERRDRERQEADRALDALPRPALRDIPGLADRLDRFRTELPLDETESGACDDGCGSHGRRYRIGRRQVCASCARRRVRVQRRLTRDDADHGEASAA